MRNTKKFDYRNSLISVNGTTYPKYEQREYDEDGVLLLDAIYPILPKLSSMAVTLFFYYIGRMSSLNIIKTEEEYRMNFINYLSKNGDRTIVDVTARKAISELVKHGLLIKVRRARYRVNPFISINSNITRKTREDLMRLYMKETGEIGDEFKEIKEEVI